MRWKVVSVTRMEAVVTRMGDARVRRWWDGGGGPVAMWHLLWRVVVMVVGVGHVWW
jgi:hypothetical protein